MRALCLKMNPNKRLAILFAIIVLVISFSIGFNEIDPFYKTNTTIPAKIIHKIHATGKSGARIEITVKTNDGEEYWFNKANNYAGQMGDQVTLRIYKRKLSRLQKYELE